MIPTYYFDIEIRASNMKEAAPITLNVMARLVRNLHGCFAQNPDTFAIAFPKMRVGQFRHLGNVVRVFAECRNNLDNLVAWIENNNHVNSNITKTYPKQVDENKIEGWMEYRRYRIPSRNSRLAECRAYRIKSSEGVPFLRMSSSDGEIFSMHIIAVEGSKTEFCSPTSYGLSGRNRFSLPVLA